MLVRLFAGAIVPLAVAINLSPAMAAEEYRSQSGPLSVVTVAEGLEHPWGLAFLPDGRMLVTEKVGPVWLVSQQGDQRGAPGRDDVDRVRRLGH